VIIPDLNGRQDTGLVRRGKMNKPISDLLKEQENKFMETESQVIENYSNNMVVELLKKSLNIHWQQTTSLSAQAVHLERWGYTKLANVIKKDAEEEHQHAMENLKRLEFFDVDYQPLVVSPVSWSRHDILGIIQYNLNSVKEAAAAEKETILAARAAGDELTANIMIPLLQGSENGIVLYEGYLKLIEQMGLDNFLSIQV
jgi:bacterioferritin